MWIVVSPQSDHAARWACHGLRARGLEPLEWVIADTLPLTSRWVYRIGRCGTTLELTLPDGRTVASERVKGVLNRLTIPPDHALLVAPADRDYVQREMAAFYLGWLNAFPCPVLNPASPQGLGGATRHRSVWRFLAARAGLECAPLLANDHEPWPPVEIGAQGKREALLFVVDGETVPAAGHLMPPERIQEAAIRLGRLSGTPLLALHFTVGTEGRWYFRDAETQPDLTFGGDPLLDALAHALTRSCGEARE